MLVNDAPRPAPRPARDEQVHRRLVQVLREVEAAREDLPLGGREVGPPRRLDRGLDVRPEDGAVALGEPGAPLGVGDRDEAPRLAVAAARRERARLAHLADQLARHRVRREPPDRARRTDALEERDVLADRRDVDHGGERRQARGM
jgi:hypothetical protein